ncbi:hypothetical protein [Niabella aquatica]
MKKLLAIIAFLSATAFVNAQTATPTQPRPAVKPVMKINAKSTPAPAVAPQPAAKPVAKATAPVPASKKTAASAAGTVHLKKDGTVDKRFKSSEHLKKDGTPDMRYKENKKS